MKQFGPNSRIKNLKVSCSTSHRSKEFQELFHSVKQLFYVKFPELVDFEIILIPGSGSIGMESLIYSLKHPIGGPNLQGRFAERWRNLIKVYGKYSMNPDIDNINLEVHFETSLSKLNNVDNIPFVDGISAFPYYEIPSDAEFYVTCTNKLLGCLAGLSVVFIRRSSLVKLSETNESYLSVKKYLDYGEINQTPYTFPEYLLRVLKEKLTLFDRVILREKVEEVSKLIFDKVPAEHIVGSLVPAPAISISSVWLQSKSKIPFGYLNSYTNTIQIFTYSEGISEYKKFLSKL